MNTLSTLENSNIDFSDFLKVDMKVGQIIEVTKNLKAKDSAYVLKIDFGSIGTKISSAQITKNYSKEELLGKQIIAVINFPTKRIAGIKSEVLILAAVCHNSGTTLVIPNLPVENGTRIS